MQPNYLLVVWRFPPGNASTKDSKLCVPGSRQVCQSFQFCGMFPAAGTILHSPGCKRCHSVAGVLIFPPGRPALSLALFYQIWPCPCKCPNGHKNGICVCFYPKSAISCRDCPIQSPQSLCTPPTKSYKFVSANPCETDTSRINKYHYIGCVRGSFWNFIPFRDSRKRCGMPKPLTLGEVARRSRDGEGKDADKKQKTQRYKPCLSETSYRCAFVFYFAGLALSGAGAPALPKGEPLAKRCRFR